jgi:hypothetical protein
MQFMINLPGRAFDPMHETGTQAIAAVCSKLLEGVMCLSSFSHLAELICLSVSLEL